ncbi:LPS assembly lipoprotein LptE [Desulfocurvus vexinensis]|uniref:LPS assembly lipoprotein LptE n=1 Tax=Desulfocurvus vexinensis TaxID=399548 RepID=UPI00048CFBE1|nr:LPS assembly lipoprotein LptE [Desulfocurvus vexinensis]
MQRVLHVLAALALGLVLASCSGYRNSAEPDAPLKLPADCRSLFLRTVTNPTMAPGLEATLRSALRDELTRRARVAWASREAATAYVDVTVHRFTSQTSLTGSDDETLKSSASISLTVEIFRRSDGALVWSADKVGASESFTGNDRTQAEANVLDMAVRRAVDRMAQNY